MERDRKEERGGGERKRRRERERGGGGFRYFVTLISRPISLSIKERDDKRRKASILF